MDNRVARIAELQRMTSEIRGRMVTDLMQLYSAKDGTPADLSLEIVAGYLQKASEDACAVAEAMCSRFTSIKEMELLTELSERSFTEFLQVFNAWKQSLH